MNDWILGNRIPIIENALSSRDCAIHCKPYQWMATITVIEHLFLDCSNGLTQSLTPDWLMQSRSAQSSSTLWLSTRPHDLLGAYAMFVNLIVFAAVEAHVYMSCKFETVLPALSLLNEWNWTSQPLAANMVQMRRTTVSKTWSLAHSSYFVLNHWRLFNCSALLSPCLSELREIFPYG